MRITVRLAIIVGLDHDLLAVFQIQRHAFEQRRPQDILVRTRTNRIEAESREYNNGEANRYISSMKVNGKNYTKNYLIHGDLMSGMNILYNMSATPNKSRGTQDSDAPYSFSNELGK